MVPETATTGTLEPSERSSLERSRYNSPPGAEVEEGSFLVSLGDITMLRVGASELDHKSYSCRAVFWELSMAWLSKSWTQSHCELLHVSEDSPFLPQHSLLSFMPWFTANLGVGNEVVLDSWSSVDRQPMHNLCFTPFFFQWFECW